MYKNTVETKEENKRVLIFDTEGLGAMDVNKKSDSRLDLNYIGYF